MIANFAVLVAVVCFALIWGGLVFGGLYLVFKGVKGREWDVAAGGASIALTVIGFTALCCAGLIQ